MCGFDKQELKARLVDANISFTEPELISIIDHEFFNDGTDADIELIDLAAMRIAKLQGTAPKDQYAIIAHAALMKLIKNHDSK